MTFKTLVPLVVVLAACGRGGVSQNLDPETSHKGDSLTSCGSLNKNECSARSDCHVVQTKCAGATCPDAVCEANSSGSGTAGPGTPTTPPPPPCELLETPACEARPDCEVVDFACPAVCIDDGKGGCKPCETPGAQCRERTPPVSECGALDEAHCAANPKCEVVVWACTLECRDDGQGGCLPCKAPGPVCQERPAPDECAGLDAQQCVANPNCQIAEYAACPAVCIDDGKGGCLPCRDSGPLCTHRIDVPPPDECTGLDAQQCAANDQCELSDPTACPAVCIDDGKGGCLPCRGADSVCVHKPVTSPCVGLSEAACQGNPSCMVIQAECTECDDKNCTPCAPTAVCVDRATTGSGGSTPGAGGGSSPGNPGQP